MKNTSNKANSRLRQILIIFSLFILTTLLNQIASAQTYATWASSSSCSNCTTISGTGTISNATVPNYTWTSTAGAANKISGVSYAIGSDEMPNSNPWETKYGTLNGTTSVLRAGHAGNSSSTGSPVTASATITTTINFSSPTFSSGWGFLFLDLDVDQMEIVSATDENNNAISTATIQSWYKSVFDANTSDGNTPPCWDSANLTAVGGSFVNVPCTKITTYDSKTDTAGSGIWFEPNVRVRQLVVRYTNLQRTATPSSRIAIAAFPSGTVSGTLYRDNNANNAYNAGTDTTLGANISVELVDSSNNVVATTVTNSSGAYTFGNVAVGSYTVRVVTTDPDLGGATPSAPTTASASVSVTSGATTTQNFGFEPLRPDLTLTKSHTGNFTVGSTGTYSFSVTNSGTASSSGTITVTDTLPTGLTVNAGAVGAITEGGTNAANWTCNSAALTGSPARQTITCTSSTAITASGSSVFNFAVNVGTSTAVGTNSITNTANVSGGGELNTTNNSSDDPTTVLAPDLTISKTDSGSSFTIGSLGNYAFTVSNSGTATSSGTITVSDTLPTGLIVNAGTAGAVTLYGTNAANWACSSNASTPQTVTCTSSTAISTSSSSTFNFDVYVGTSTPSSITNTATVAGGGEVNTTNNSGNDSTTVLAEPTAPAPGTVCTNGTAVNLLSTVPSSIFQDANVTSGISSTIPLIANASNYRLGTGASNRIIVDLSWGWNNGEPSASSTQSTYTLTVNGTDYARITTERNPIGVVATVVGLNGASVSDSTIVVGSYPPSNYQQSYVTLPASVTQVTSGSVVYASPGASPGDDVGVRVSTIYACSPSVSVTKSSNGAWSIGQTGAQYTLDVTNSGSTTTFGTTTVSDALPTGITANWTGTRSVVSNGLTWACTFSGQDVSCTTSNGLSNSTGSNTSQITLPVNVTSATAIGTNSITNYASIGGGGDPYNSGSAPTPGSTCTNTAHCANNQTTVNSPDLTIDKSHVGNFSRGSTGTYTLTVGNGGTAVTSGTITVSDTLPTGLSIANGAVTLSGTNSADWSCSSTSNVITCTTSTVIAISGSSIFSFVVNVASNAAAIVTNIADVSGGNEATANNGNNSANDPTNTISSPPNVNLAKTCPSPSDCTTAPQLPGTDVTYNIAFTNSGGQGASNMAIVDGIPANTDFKLSSVTTSVGTTGLTIAVEYSSDPALAIWTYTPVSGGGGASTGYDRNVKAVRWRVTSGTLSNISPDNSGSVGFVAKIR